MENERTKLKRMSFWTIWCALLIAGIMLLKPFWIVVFVALWILFGIIVYWADTSVEIEDEEMEL